MFLIGSRVKSGGSLLHDFHLLVPRSLPAPVIRAQDRDILPISIVEYTFPAEHTEYDDKQHARQFPLE